MASRGCVIGAGALGLACGVELARRASGRGEEVWVLEQLGAPGRATSSRNSQVVHAGLYYPAGSLKAELCVEGRERLWSRCVERRIPHRRCGKYVVACSAEELPRLEDLQMRGLANGAGDLEQIDAARLVAAEPRVRGVAALWSPQSGIVDAHRLMASDQAELAALGGQLVCHTRVVALERRAGGWRIETRSASGEREALDADWIVNACGLDADRTAALAGLPVDSLGWKHHPCKGDYFSVAPALGPLSDALIYPLPEPGGLGVHVTLDLGGRFRLGPDVEWIDEPHYRIDASKAQRFAAAAQRFLPEIRAEHLQPEFSGIRPKLVRAGEPAGDFVIEETSAHGAPGFVHLGGIESPGLTASQAIAQRVADLLLR